MSAQFASIYCMNAVMPKFREQLFPGDVAVVYSRPSIISDFGHAD
jgi:hypothetical protein